MAIGLPAKHGTTIELNIPRDSARTSVALALDALGWPFRSPDRDTFEATLPASLSSWGERVKISLSPPGGLEIESRGLAPFQVFDWGKNARNVAAFILVFEAKADSKLRTPACEPEHFDSGGKTPLDRALEEQ